MPETDRRTFAQVCHAAARQLHARVDSIREPGATLNFHIAVLVRDEYRIAILCHQHLPLLALAVPPADRDMEITFIDDADAAAALRSLTSFSLLSRAELGTPLARTDLSALADAELEQVAYWKPHTMGGLLFNYWD
ncbi:hypothetical protein [Actinomadura sp. 9N407]|uniref:hypothetical protein n=1 Tax=Actinomadura sp. 9N407 TaxID=3375154 RepID=UPI00379C6379